MGYRLTQFCLVDTYLSAELIDLPEIGKMLNSVGGVTQQAHPGFALLQI
ncbi:hypothetical protein [Neptuniibacter sp. CAU 1671]|nr:hypothetical protein [Neptuniibacter sp. CAU 1671]MDF2182274.1 hypothetical protein [Neptuniibacter sp. CAU 1671]